MCSGCNASGGSVTIKAPAELTYSGGDKEATLDDQLTTGVTVSASDIGYRMGASLTGELLAGSYPRNAGTYTASITLGEGTGAVTASVTYTIGKKDLTITANGNTITYGDTAFDRGVTYKGFVDGEDAGVLGGSLTYIFSSIPVDKEIRVNDRGAIVNFMLGLNAYTISSGIFPKYLNGENIISVPLAENETMHIGYVLNENQELSELGKSYLEELRKYAPANP